LYYTHAFTNTPFFFGLGVYAPYGLSADWGNNAPFAAIAQKGTLLYLTFNPVVAWRATKTLSLAIGPTINYANIDLQNASFNFKGDDTSPGFTAGLLWQPHRMWSFGVNYHSATDFKFEGSSQFPAFSGLPGNQATTTADAHVPQFVVGGVSFRPTPKWNFEFDLDWTDWDSLKTVVFQRSGGSPLLPSTVPDAFNYRSSFIYDFGATRQLGNGWLVSTGYIYSENSIPDANLNPLVVDSNLQLGSAGFGHHGKRFDWAVGYQFAYNGGRTVTGGQGSSVLADGTYKTFNNAVNISMTWKF
jgi:long-chain fatty acid transport protein